MADLEPADLFAYNRPVEGGFVDAVEIRNFLTALARQHYTTDIVKPVSPQDGQPRINASNPANVKLEVYLSGAWRVLLQNIENGLAAPTKRVVQFDVVSASWVIDHNFGSLPIVYVLDSSLNVLTPVPLLPAVERIHLGTIPAAIFATLPAGATVLRAALPVDFNATFLSAFAVAAEPVTGAPDGLFEFEIAGQGAMAGGDLPWATATLGQVLAGSGALGNNNLTAGGTLEVRAQTTTAPTGGALDLYATVQRTTNQGNYTVANPTLDRTIISHPSALTGFAVLVG
jgi:hypothetical protein